jgi:hypothetical protein
VARMFVRHRVADYATWRTAYDEFGPTRDSLGVTGHAVYQAAGDPLDVTVTHDFHDVESAQAFASSPELKAAMQNAGVAGPPEIWFTVSA